MELSKLSDAALEVAAVVFPHLPIAEAVALLGEVFGKNIELVSDEELDAYLIERLQLQRDSLG